MCFPPKHFAMIVNLNNQFVQGLVNMAHGIEQVCSFFLVLFLKYADLGCVTTALTINKNKVDVKATHRDKNVVDVSEIFRYLQDSIVSFVHSGISIVED